MSDTEPHGPVSKRAFELSQEPGAGTPQDNWLRAEHELRVAHGYDTEDRDLEALGMALARLPLEAGVMWRLTLPRGERIEEWEPGNAGLAPPAPITQLLGAAAAGKPLVPAPPVLDEPGARRLRETLSAQRKVLLAHDPGVRVGRDPENLHQHRVAARRTRALLRAARAQIDPDWRRAVSNLLSDLGRLTGPVRDLDVLIEHVADEAKTLHADDRPGAEHLSARLRSELARRRIPLLEELDSESYRRLLTTLRHPPRLAEGVDAVPLRRIARREFRRFARTVDSLGKRPDESTLHSLRIALKRVRYAAEIAAPDDERGRRFVDDAKHLQDLLGEHQDAVVAERHLRSSTVVDSATAAAFVAGRIAERQARRRELVRAQLPAAWKRIRRSGSKLGR